jgi:alkylated DNA repair dioxygenase AlkB
MDLEIINETDGTHSIFMYIPNFIKNSSYYLDIMNNFTNNDWKTGDYNHHELDRVQRFYSINKQPFCEHWKTQPSRWQPFDYENWLLELQQRVEINVNDLCKDLMNNYPNFNSIDFSSALINKYRNGDDYIPEHRDSVVMDRDPTIVSLTFGQTREFRINRILPIKNITHDLKHQFSKTWKLKSGDLFIMAGSSQKYFSHEILKDTSINPRYNITFR